jgi:hypothetical protein
MNVQSILIRAYRSLQGMVILMVVLVCGIVVWALWFERPFLSYKNLPFPTEMAVVRPGDVIPLRVARCNSSDTVRFYGITHELISLDRLNEPSSILRHETVALSPGCEESISRLNVIPPATQPGRYMARGIGIAQGMMRTFSVPWYSQPFEVVAP